MVRDDYQNERNGDIENNQLTRSLADLKQNQKYFSKNYFLSMKA